MVTVMIERKNKNIILTKRLRPNMYTSILNICKLMMLCSLMCFMEVLVLSMDRPVFACVHVFFIGIDSDLDVRV